MHELIDVLLKPDIPPEHVCTVQPLTMMQNAAFVVSIDSVEFEDLKADDLGSWKGTGTKMYFRDLQSGAVRLTVSKPTSNAAAEYFLLTRRHFIHKIYGKFHRMIADVRGMLKYLGVHALILL